MPNTPNYNTGTESTTGSGGLVNWRETSEMGFRPGYADLTDYPDSLSVGHGLFPMLAIYYLGKNEQRAKIDVARCQEELEWHLQDLYAGQGLSYADSAAEGEPTAESRATEKSTEFMKNVPKLTRMFTDAVAKNPQFLWQLANEVASLMAKYSTRLPQTRGQYYHHGSGKNRVFTYHPTINPSDPDCLDNCMEALRLLWENDIIPYDLELNVRPINIYDGAFADEHNMQMPDAQARLLGLPVRGVFTLNRVPRTSAMYHTFSGIDITAVASLNTHVSDMEGLTTLSWSLHRGNSSIRPLGKTSGGARGKGSRTIAGTMVFAITDHHPLHDIIPDDFPVKNPMGLINDPKLWRPMMLADQIPPFDLMIILTNEYGYASIVGLYGIEIQDEGVVLGIDNLITEMTLNYTAFSMDPIMQVKTDENGIIDPYGLLHGGYSKLLRHRELVVAGVAYSDLEKAYEAQYDTMFNQW